jgi:hypothetical protein
MGRRLGATAAVLAAALSAPLHAQAVAQEPIVIGIVGGLSSAKVVVSGGGASIALDGRTGIAAGATLAVPFGAVWVEFGGVYVQKGFHAAEGSASSSLDLSYLEFPLLVRYDFGGSELIPFVLGGAWVAAKANCRASVSSGGVLLAESCGSEVHAADYGVAVGAGIARGRLSASLRYAYGLGDILDGEAPGTTTRNRSFLLLAGYTFSGGR